MGFRTSTAQRVVSWMIAIKTITLGGRSEPSLQGEGTSQGEHGERSEWVG
jgi:hypothetical protein